MTGIWFRMLIGILTAESDVERKMLGKHAYTIRNHIDAHKSSSFERQYETFRSCNWGQAVYDLLVLIQISDRLLGVVESIFSKYKHEIEVVTDKIKGRVSKLDAILEKLKQE